MSALPRAPAELAWAAELIGAEATLALVEAYGGIALYVPREVNQASPLALAIGLPAARALAQAHGGEDWIVPLVKWWRARCYRAQGLNVREIARRLQMTEKSVSAMLARARPPGEGKPGALPGQMDMFGLPARGD